MIKNILGIVVIGLLWCNVGFAEKWTRYGETKSLTVYYDKKSWKIDASKAYINILYDLKKPLVRAEGTFNSMVMYQENDCKEFKSRVLETFFYETQMGQNKYLTSAGKSKWKQVSEYTSLDGSLFKAACKIK